MTIQEQIQSLKKKQNTVILAHNYQLKEIQDIADYVGDSLGLSFQAKNTKADIILFCGVYFMAETAKIISPKKKVLIPDKRAGCPMADMIKPDQLKALKEKHPRAKVLTYVNSSAGIKALSDICCTSSNAPQIVQKYFKAEDEIIFIPDKHLALHTARLTGRNFILWNGFCPTHIKIIPEYIRALKKEHPEAEVLVHPECIPETIAIAGKALSTDGMYKHVQKSEKKEFIIGTEIGMLHRLQKDFPDKRFYPVTTLASCPNMKKITLDKVLRSLEEGKEEVTVHEETAAKALKSIEAMLDCVS